MSSSKASDLLNLERALPVTEADVASQHRAPPSMSLDDYLKALAQLPQPSMEELRQRPGPAAGPPFYLP